MRRIGREKDDSWQLDRWRYFHHVHLTQEREGGACRGPISCCACFGYRTPLGPSRLIYWAGQSSKQCSATTFIRFSDFADQERRFPGGVLGTKGEKLALLFSVRLLPQVKSQPFSVCNLFLYDKETLMLSAERSSSPTDSSSATEEVPVSSRNKRRRSEQQSENSDDLEDEMHQSKKR